MKSLSVALTAAAAAMFAADCLAQPPREGDRPGAERGERPEGDRGPGGFRGGDRGPGGFQPPAPPMMVALDTNSDGELSKSEIENASKALKTLDKDGDGKISREEMRPPGGPGRTFGGAGGPGGFQPGDMVNRMMEADANKDGKISKEEAPERMQQGFDRLDANSDGYLDKKEIEAMAERFSGAGGRPGGDRGRPAGDRPEGDRPRGDRPEGDRPRGDRPEGDRPTGDRPSGERTPLTRDDI